MTETILDWKERKAALNPFHSVHVESPAGSGKTGLLIERFLVLLNKVDHPSQILAMTFTRKAAAEMKNRILWIFNAACLNNKGENDYINSLIKLAGSVLEKYQGDRREMLLSGAELQITTIHGLCLRLCQRAPVESGLEPGLKPLEEEEQKEFYKETVRKLIHDLFKLPPDTPLRSALESRLLLHNMYMDGFINEMASLISKRDQLIDLFSGIPLKKGKKAFERQLNENIKILVERHLQELLHIMKETPLAGKWGEFSIYLEKQDAPCSRNFPTQLPGCAWSDLPSWQNVANILLTNKGQVRKRWGPRSGGLPRGFSKTKWAYLLDHLDDRIAPYLFESLSLPTSEALPGKDKAVFDLILLVSAALEKYKELCQSRGVIDYVDMELGALRGLGQMQNVTDVLLYWDRAIKHILVDEFQDTSLTQYKILQTLVSGWEEGDGRTLFLVGDPKQSIYRFRKAEVSLFYQAANGIDCPGYDPFSLKRIVLKTNFRSSPELIDWVNDTFGQTVMVNPRKEFDDVDFIKAVASSLSEPSKKLVNLAVFMNKDSTAFPRQDEADYLAYRVSRCLKDLSPGETIGILLFTRTHLSTYLEAFRKRKIPLRVKEGLKLAETPEVSHLANLARAIVRPHDDLAWYSAMRSPWITVPIHSIQTLLNSEGHTVFQKIHSTPTGDTFFENFKEAMKIARARLARDNLGTVVGKTWEMIGGPEKVASIMGVQGVANCLHFLDKLTRVEESTPEETIEKMEVMLGTLYDPSDPASAESPVQMMTVHGAKGLEFDYCFIPWLDYSPKKTGQNEKPAYLAHSIGNTSLLVSRPDTRSGERDKVYDLLYKIEQGKTVSEAKRLFYVAVTRAKKAVFLSAVCGKRPPSSGPLKWIMDHFGVHKIEEDLREGEYGGTRIEINPYPLSLDKVKRDEPVQIPDPREFMPESLPYRLVAPSQLAYFEPTMLDRVSEKEGSDIGRIRGKVMHLVLEHMASGIAIPDIHFIKRKLILHGARKKESEKVAEEILEQVHRCQQDPFFTWIMRQDFPWSASEWAVEVRGKPGVIYSGKIDRIIFDGKKYWVIDYKTNRPDIEEDEAVFIERMKREFLAQLKTYVKMVCSIKKCSQKDVISGIYLTALFKWVKSGTKPA